VIMYGTPSNLISNLSSAINCFCFTMQKKVQLQAG
jgi:hypothetical protein